MEKYANFEVWIDTPSDQPQMFPVQVVNSPAGLASGSLALNLEDHELTTGLSIVQTPGPALAEREIFGRQILNALFTGKVRDIWQTSRGRVDAGEADGLHLRLLINDPRLAALPPNQPPNYLSPISGHFTRRSSLFSLASNAPMAVLPYPARSPGCYSRLATGYSVTWVGARP